MKERNYFWLLVSLAVAGIAATWGGFYAEALHSDWFTELVKPPLFPSTPLLLAGWAAAFSLMAVGAWLVGEEASFETLRQVQTSLTSYAITLLCFVAWCHLLFFQHRFGWAALGVLVLWISVLLSTWAFFRVRKAAGALLLPALLWISFHVYLGCGIAVHHSETLGDMLRRLL